MEKTSFKLKAMVGFDWNSLDALQRENLVKLIFEFPLMEEAPNRFGFVKCQQINKSQIYGYFAQEVEVDRHRYNNQKHEEEHKDIYSEDFFFILLFDSGLCLLQSRKIKEISIATIEEKFTDALKRIFEKIGATFYYLEDYSLKREKEDFIRIFTTENIISLKVDSLKGRIIPEDFKIFNPELEKDPIIRAYLNDEFRVVDALSPSTTQSGGLQRSKLSKAALITGEPREIEFIGPKNEKITWKDKMGPSISLDIDVEAPRTKDIAREVEKLSSKLTVGDKKQKVKERQTRLSDF
jgi:hypothetical protein